MEDLRILERYQIHYILVRHNTELEERVQEPFSGAEADSDQSNCNGY